MSPLLASPCIGISRSPAVLQRRQPDARRAHEAVAHRQSVAHLGLIIFRKPPASHNKHALSLGRHTHVTLVLYPRCRQTRSCWSSSIGFSALYKTGRPAGKRRNPAPKTSAACLATSPMANPAGPVLVPARALRRRTALRDSRQSAARCSSALRTTSGYGVDGRLGPRPGRQLPVRVRVLRPGSPSPQGIYRAPAARGREQESEEVALERGRLDAVSAGATRRLRRARRRTCGS